MTETVQSPRQHIHEEFVNAPGVVVHDDTFSVYDENEQSATTSLSSSVLNYEYENGRRYHAYSQGKYIMPNDDAEQDRLDLAHHIYLLLLGGELFLAPIKEPANILDLGTGTGIWAIEVADMFPGARVTGNDLSAIQPSFVPPNLEFIIDDFENEWIYAENWFDFIHARDIIGCVRDWPWFMRQVYKHLKPNAYFEFAQTTIRAWSDDGSLKDDSPYMQYLSYLREGGERRGQKMDIAHELKHLAEEAGFEDVVEKVYMCPLGPWPKDEKLKEVGQWVALHNPDAVDSFGLRLYTQDMGWDSNAAKIHHALVKQQLRDKSLHAYCKIYFVYGRKPAPKPTAQGGTSAD